MHRLSFVLALWVLPAFSSAQAEESSPNWDSIVGAYCQLSHAQSCKQCSNPLTPANPCSFEDNYQQADLGTICLVPDFSTPTSETGDALSVCDSYREDELVVPNLGPGGAGGVVGRMITWRSSAGYLHVTAQLGCSERTGLQWGLSRDWMQSVAGSSEPQVAIGFWRKDGSLVETDPQYVQVVPNPGAPYTCLTTSIPLDAVCDPNVAEFSPISEAPGGCVARAGAPDDAELYQDLTSVNRVQNSLQLSVSLYSVSPSGSVCYPGSIDNNSVLIARPRGFGDHRPFSWSLPASQTCPVLTCV